MKCSDSSDDNVTPVHRKNSSVAAILSGEESSSVVEEPVDDDDAMDLWKARTENSPLFLASNNNSLKGELNEYFRELIVSPNVNPEQWGSSKGLYSFPKLFDIYKQYGCIPASSVASERLFSSGGRMCSYTNYISRYVAPPGPYSPYPSYPSGAPPGAGGPPAPPPWSSSIQGKGPPNALPPRPAAHYPTRSPHPPMKPYPSTTSPSPPSSYNGPPNYNSPPGTVPLPPPVSSSSGAPPPGSSPNYPANYMSHVGIPPTNANPYPGMGPPNNGGPPNNNSNNNNSGPPSSLSSGPNNAHPTSSL
ncbi:unnamed protein product [Lepeophtheirus salmonis]|uniref:(salmon louse) hypothetical protein n=1 Tax=Lepeophtheirus salmonis TaxID=72036 RepID=A0A7R8HF07_LEPSM|nr:unnamed protein product [Lepeophtheirus salmonis]CAF3036996.1 unnamed protein product [Lepeophtheirus salmonis]